MTPAAKPPLSAARTWTAALQQHRPARRRRNNAAAHSYFNGTHAPFSCNSRALRLLQASGLACRTAQPLARSGATRASTQRGAAAACGPACVWVGGGRELYDARRRLWCCGVPPLARTYCVAPPSHAPVARQPHLGHACAVARSATVLPTALRLALGLAAGAEASSWQ
jgi:hypothetical protein